MAKLRVQFSLTGLAHMPRDEVVDTAELSDQWEEVAARLLTPATLREQAEGRGPTRPDAEVWQLTLLDAEPSETFELDLSSIDSDLVDLLDEVRALIIDRSTPDGPPGQAR